MTTRRRTHVLIEPNANVARKLRDAPGKWFLVGAGELCDRATLSQTAYRIREGQLADFPITPAGRFEALATADTRRPNPIAPVELSARFVPTVS